MALGRGSDLRRSSFLLSKGCAAFRGRGHLEARTACRSETNMPLVLILGQTPRMRASVTPCFFHSTSPATVWRVVRMQGSPPQTPGVVWIQLFVSVFSGEMACSILRVVSGGDHTHAASWW
jgi:hypothetical protein